MLDQSVIAFTIAAAVLTVTPGNDTVLVLRNSIAGHRATGFATLFGICSGLIIHGSFAALGISVVLMRSASLFQIVKLIGAAYLIFLGIQSLLSAWRTRRLEALNLIVNSAARRHGVWKSYVQGLLNNVLNPKVALFYLAFLPQFIRQSDPLFKPLFLAGIHMVQGIIWLSIIVLLIDRLRHLLARPRNKAVMEAVTGSLLTGLGIRLALANR